MIVGKPGVDSVKDLKGQKVGVELTLVEHMLLMQALKVNGMTASDVTLVGTPTNNTPQVLASGSVAAIGAWYPISYQALTQVPGSKRLFTSAEAKGLIYDVLAVSPTSLAARHDDWAKVAAVYYKCVAYLMDPATRDDAIKIMAAKVGRPGGLREVRPRDALRDARRGQGQLRRERRGRDRHPRLDGRERPGAAPDRRLQE